MDALTRIREGLTDALRSGDPGLSAADRLCHACVSLLNVDGAAVSVMRDGTTQGTFGSSGALSRRLDEFQFTFGEGPCLESVRLARPILVADLRQTGEHSWPAYAPAVLEEGIRAVYALPVPVGAAYVGALDLFRGDPGPLAADDLMGGLLAAEFAAIPLRDLMNAPVDWLAHGEQGWDQLASLERIEVYQATGMIMGQLGVDATEALARLRARAFAAGLTASEIAWQIVDRRLRLDHDTPPGLGDTRPVAGG